MTTPELAPRVEVTTYILTVIKKQSVFVVRIWEECQLVSSRFKESTNKLKFLDKLWQRSTDCNRRTKLV